MNVERVMVVKTIRIANGILCTPGTIFPNSDYPEIPKDIRLELIKDRGTVVVLQGAPLAAQVSAAEAVKTPLTAPTAAEATQPPKGTTEPPNDEKKGILEPASKAPKPETEPAGGKQVPKPGAVTTRRTRKPIVTK